MRLRTKASLQRRIAGLLLAFALLVVIALGTISWTRATQQRDTLLLSLAERQPLLIEQMMDNALELEDQVDYQRHLAGLNEAAGTFEQTLWALSNGGSAPYLSGQTVEVPAAGSPDAQARLHGVHHTWDVFRSYLNVLMATKPGHADFSAALQSMQGLVPELTQESQAVARHYQAAATLNSSRLGLIQAAVFAGALGLLGAGYLVSQKTILSPLRSLRAVTERISRGDLNTPVQITGPREIEAIALSLDTMRLQLRTSQEELSRRSQRLERSSPSQRQLEWEAANEFSQNLLGDLDLAELLSSVAERARALTWSEAAILCLLDAQGGSMSPVAASEAVSVQPNPPKSAGPDLVARLFASGENAPIKISCADCRFFKAHPEGLCLASPLRAGEQTVGALCVSRSGPGPYTDDEMRALSLLANSTAIAIANACLVEASRSLAQRTAGLAERERLAADLHDDLAQTLGFLNLKAERLGSLLDEQPESDAVQELASMQSALKAAFDEVRAMLIRLRQPSSSSGETWGESALAWAGQPAPTRETPAEWSLAAELAAFVAQLRQTYALPIELDVSQAEASALPAPVQKQALHIVREALTNACRHAQARHVWVCMERLAECDEVSFTVRDDGLGFEPDRIRGDDHLGLTIMQARAERSGGHMVVESAPGRGTRVQVHFPLHAN